MKKFGIAEAPREDTRPLMLLQQLRVPGRSEPLTS